jgi:hypothetical protein
MKNSKTMTLNASRAARRLTRRIAAAAAVFAAIFTNCGTDLDTDYDDQTQSQDRATRQYSINLPDPGERGGISASHAAAKLGTTITVNYIPPEQADEETAQADESLYTVTYLSVTYNDGQKTVKTSKGGGGDGRSPCPTPTYF